MQFSTAELRTIGLCDVTSDSELSIRHLELTPNTSENSFRLNPTAHFNSKMQKHSKESIDSGCQNETQNCENIRSDDTWRHCDLNIVDITKHNSNNRKMDTLDLAVNCRKSSSSTLSDASSCGTNQSASGEQINRKDSPKYHSARKCRQRKDTLVSRSKSFQEQDVRKPSNARFYIVRRNPHNNFDNDYKLCKTISHHNIEITIEDTDAKDEPINHISTKYQAQTKNKRKQNECSSLNSSDFNYDRHKIRSGHILSRIFRRMRKLSMGWRRSKNKCRTRRGELQVNIFLHSFGFI